MTNVHQRSTHLTSRHSHFRQIQFIALLDGSSSATTWDRFASQNRPSILNDWHDEVRLALQHVARWCTWSDCEAHEVPLIAVVHFDPGGGHDLAPTPLVDVEPGRLATTVTVPLGGTGSSLSRALAVAEQHASRRRDLLTVLSIYSDFDLFDTDLPGVRDRFASFPGRVHAIVLGHEAPSWLAAMRKITITEIPWNGRPGAVTRATLAAISPAML